MTLYTLVSAIVFLILFGIWTKKNFYNLVLKVSFLLLAVWGLVERFAP
jgi:NADH:ubiquinone oxidoreductase subunit K